LRDHFGRYRFASQYIFGSLGLDISCGAGYGSAYLQHKGTKEVISCDLSKGAIKEAVSQFGLNSSLNFIVTVATYLPFGDNLFDTIISLELIEHLENPGNFLEEYSRTLRKKGFFVCSTPNLSVTLAFGVISPYHVHEYREGEFCQLQLGGVSNLVLYEAKEPDNIGVKEKLMQLVPKFYLQIVYLKPQLFGLLTATKNTIGLLVKRKNIKLEAISPSDFDKIFPSIIVVKDMSLSYSTHLYRGFK
jgi:SAM-dependent methyltransferase